MKIGIVCHPTYGGSGVVATELGIALAAREHEVHFISHALPFRLPPVHPNTWFHKVDVTNYPLFTYPPYTLALACKIDEICRTERLDVVHVHYAIPHAISAHLAKQLLGTAAPRIVTTLHGTDITLIGIDSSFFEMTRLGINESDAVTAVSNSLADETVARFRPRRAIQQIGNFVHLEKFHPSRRSENYREKYSREGDRLIGHMSNFRSVKRIGDVVRTFHLIQKRIPSQLLLVGEGAEIEPARHLAAELGIDDCVHFLGAVPDAGSVLAQLDLFLLPSEYESFGLAALEAMACGVPVIATNTGGIPEVVTNGATGILCDVGDYACMAAAAVELLQSEERHREMGRAGRKRAEEEYSEKRIVSQYETLYENLLTS